MHNAFSSSSVPNTESKRPSAIADALKSKPVTSSAAACAKPKAASSILEGIEDNPSDSVTLLIFLPTSLTKTI